MPGPKSKRWNDFAAPGHPVWPHSRRRLERMVCPYARTTRPMLPSFYPGPGARVAWAVRSDRTGRRQRRSRAEPAEARRSARIGTHELPVRLDTIVLRTATTISRGARGSAEEARISIQDSHTIEGHSQVGRSFLVRQRDQVAGHHAATPPRLRGLRAR